MRNLLCCVIISFCLLQFACKRNKQQQGGFDFKPPEVAEAKSYKVPPEKTTPPKIIPATGEKKIKAGKPEIVQLKSNIFPAKPKRIIQAGVPNVSTPGEDSVILPGIVPAIDSPFAAGAPEIITVDKDFQSKDVNSESFSSMSVAHGLKYAEVNALLQDRTGNIWIATWDGGGVSKYDGRTLTNYSVGQGLSSEHVFSFLEDRNGNVWVGTDHNGINKFDGKFITRYKIGHGQSNNFVLNMIQDNKGNIWFATSNGLIRYDGISFAEYNTVHGLPANYISCILEDSKENLWVGTKGGIARFDGHLFLNYTDVFGLSENVRNSGEVIHLVEDEHGNLWIATNNDGLYKYDGKSISHFTAQCGLSSDKISKLAKDQKGNIWIATGDSGLNKFDGRSFTHYGIEQGLSSMSIFSLLVDKSGVHWLGTGAGIYRYNGTIFSHIQAVQGPNKESIVCINADKNENIWIGTNGGSLSKFDGKSITRFTPRQGLRANPVTDVLEDRSGNIWIANWGGGISKFDGSSLTRYSAANGLIDNEAMDLLEDKSGNIWIATDGGLSKFDGKDFTNYSKANGLSSDDINSLFEDHHGNFWIGTRDDGLAKFDGTSFTNYNVTNGLGNAAITCIAEDKKNNLWLGTNGGLINFDGKHFTHYTAEQGLNGNIVTNIIAGDNGDIWIGTNNGLNRFDTDTEYSGKAVTLFKKYTSSEGFLGVWGYFKTMAQDKNGDIWIGAWDRLTKYHPEGDISDTIPPVVQIRGVSIFDENINWAGLEKKKDTILVLSNGTRLKNFKFSNITAWYSQPQNLQLTHNNNYITFHFIGTTTNRPKEVQYKYFLEGLDKQWSSLISIPEATYNNLPPGKYTFKVKAVNSEGYWSNELSYPFVIRPPWWFTWWAYLCYGIVFATSIWLFTWYRSRSLKHQNIALEEKVNKRTTELEQSLQEKYELNKKIESQQALLNERLRISRELHDDIGSTLGSISIYSEVARKRTQKNENTNEVLSKIGLASRELIDKMSDIVWSLNPGNETFEQLQNRMMAFAAMVLAPRNILYNFISDEGLKTIRLTSEQRKNIFLIFKEALYNIVKYACCKNVHISLATQANGLAITIQDDGKGFDVYQSAANEVISNGEYLGGNGIRNMKARADDMSAEFCIDSKIYKGTTIQLIVSL
jgi:ligand-binding sensor domain-containing protein/signal transduction histidine kinase